MKLRNRKKGFTLAEVLIVIAIIAILGALAVVGVNAYKKNMKVTELDNAARALYISAQNHMTAAKASGKLQTIDISAEGTHYSDPAAKLSDWDSATYGGFTGHDFYAVKYKPGDTVDEDGLLDTMLPFGSIDDTVRLGYSYIIEVDWSTYTVYGVFVTDKDDLDMAVTSEANLRTSKDARKGHDPILGYYGGAEAGQLDESAALSVKLRIENSQVLKVVVTDETYTAGASGNNSL
ncbi:MAG: prepilin-type N-terminal cleavage/methylation domain-containing protein, partial [Firmicutes bacterium]|nr:prepilin-type N-terminal cleavage/methylation domain-containing protein [Bacillota bacterium]